MKPRTFVGLFAGNVAIIFFGGGLLPLMPLYAKMRGASAELAGSYVAIAFLLLSAGAFLGGRLADRIRSRRLLLVVSGAVVVPITWLVGRTTGVWPLIVTTAAAWFPGGIYLPVSGAIAGREAEPASRGRVFGALGLAGGVGTTVSSAVAGPVAQSYGYPTLLAIIAAVLAIAPLAALILVREVSRPPSPRPVHAASAASGERPPLGAAIVLLLGAQVFLYYTAGTGGLGASFAMDAASYGAAQISRTNAVASLIGLPLPLVFGWLSDRLSRKGIVVGSCLLRAACMLLLMVSRALWQFGAALTLIGVAASANGVSSALAADVAHPARVGSAVGFLQSAQWLGQVAGSALAGMLFQRAGLPAGFVVGAVLGLAAAALTLAVRKRAPAAPEASA